MDIDYVFDCTKDVDPTYRLRLRVKVNWVAVISCDNKTANIYVKKLHSLYQLCKGDFTDIVMVKFEFCNGDLCSFISPTTKSPLQS